MSRRVSEEGRVVKGKGREDTICCSIPAEPPEGAGTRQSPEQSKHSAHQASLQTAPTPSTVGSPELLSGRPREEGQWGRSRASANA